MARVLKPGAVLFSPPAMCADLLANLLALAKGKNIFYDTRDFYGSTDRHNREYTPAEVVATVEQSGLQIVDRFLLTVPTTGMGQPWSTCTKP